MSDVIDLYSTEAIQRRLERSLKQLVDEREADARTGRVTEREADEDPDAPRDCVRQFPCVGDMSTELVAFDFDGVPRLGIRFGRDVPITGWEEWMMRWTRRRYGRRILAVVD